MEAQSSEVGGDVGGGGGGVSAWDALPGSCIEAVCVAGGGSLAAKCALVCRSWHDAVNSEGLWEKLAKNELHLSKRAPCDSWREAYVRRIWTGINWRRGKAFVSSLDGHAARVSSIAMDEKIILSGSWDGTARVWDQRYLHCTNVLQGHGEQVTCVALGPAFAFTGSADHTIRVWERATWRCVHVLHGHTATVRCIATADDYVISGGSDSTLHAWHAATGRHVRQFVRRGDGVWHILALAMDSTCIAAGCDSGDVIVFGGEGVHNVQSLISCEATFAGGHAAAVISVALDDRFMVSAAVDESILVRARGNWQSLRMLSQNVGPVREIGLSSDWMVSVSSDNVIRIWSKKTWFHITDVQDIASADVMSWLVNILRFGKPGNTFAGAMVVNDELVAKADGDKGITVLQFAP
eukprot:jgi/Chlat1/4275/Chrsp29S04366